MKNTCIIRKYTAILVLSVMAVLFLPELMFAQGVVVAYAHPVGPRAANNLDNFPSNDQLNRLTHVIVTAIGVNTNGTLKFKSNDLPNTWNGNMNIWLQGLVGRAHSRGVKVSISISGMSEFKDPTSTPQKLDTFVGEIVTFVNNHGLDGVDINWEPASTLSSTEWTQCINLLNALKNHSQFSGKRLSIALPHSNWFYPPNQTVQQGIWNAVDAIHLMTYDVEGGTQGWPSHSNADYSIGGIENWIAGGTPNSYKKKLFMGCAFYGWHPDVGDTRVSYRDIMMNGSICNNLGDNTASVATKTNYCYSNGYGGVFAWELGFDVAATSTNPPSLLNAIWNATRPVLTGPTEVCYDGSTFTLSNAPSGSVTWSVSGPFTVSGNGATVTVTRTGTSYSNGTLTVTMNGVTVSKTIVPCTPPTINGDGTNIGYDGRRFTMNNPPPSINPPPSFTWTLSGPFSFHYATILTTFPSASQPLVYRTTASGTGMLQLHIGGANGEVVASMPLTQLQSTISGHHVVCYYGSNTFTLNDPPPGTIEWSVSGPFDISSSSGNQVTLTKPNLSNAGGTLTAKVNGTTVATISIESCQTKISGPSELNSGEIGVYEMPYIPNATYSWWNLYGVLSLSSGSNYATCEAPYGLYGIEYENIYCSVTINGVISYFSKYVTIYGGMSPVSAYPNPASGMLNIEIDVNAVATQRSAVGLQTDPTYDIRLYDGLGNIVRQQRTKSSTVQFNVTNLQEGTYYLHIYDGVSNKPEMKQIIVQH